MDKATQELLTESKRIILQLLDIDSEHSLDVARQDALQLLIKLEGVTK